VGLAWLVGGGAPIGESPLGKGKKKSSTGKGTFTTSAPSPTKTIERIECLQIGKLQKCSADTEGERNH